MYTCCAIHKSVYIYVTRSGKRYISAQKFEIALSIPLKRTLRWLYDDAECALIRDCTRYCRRGAGSQSAKKIVSMRELYTDKCFSY